MGTAPAPSRPFTPQREPLAQLDDRTVGRDQLRHVLHAKVLSAATSSARPHVLLVGAPGAGKTHLVEVVLHRARTDPVFTDRVVVVRVTREGFGVTRYADLLAEVLGALDPDGAHGTGVPAASEREARIGELLRGRVILLVIENLDRVFDALGIAGQRALRAWVETTGQVMLLTTAPTLFAGVRERDQPWFGGLATFVLPDLTPDQAQQLVAHVAERRGDLDLATFVRSATGRARLVAMAGLTGASPRIWMLLGGHARRSTLDELTPALLDVLEVLVPHHEHLLWDRSANERRLIWALAATTGSATVTELAHLAGLEQRTAASALGRMAGHQLVVAQKPEGGDRRTTYYRLSSALLRHHLQFQACGDDVLPVVAALLRAHHDPSVRQPPDGAALERLRAGNVGGALQVARDAGPAGGHSAQRTADVVLAALARTVRGGPPGASPTVLATRSPVEVLIDRLLAAARGDATALVALPPEWQRLLEPNHV